MDLTPDLLVQIARQFHGRALSRERADELVRELQPLTAAVREAARSLTIRDEPSSYQAWLEEEARER